MRRSTIVPVLALLVLPVVGCEDVLFEDPEHVYTGPPQVEFAPVLPAGNYTRTITFTATATANLPTSVRVNYIAPLPSADIGGEITRVSTSTAVEGTHYRFASGSRYTIKSGTNSVEVPIEVLAAGFAPGASVTLVLELSPGSGFEVAEKYKRFTFTLRRSS
jgi:hypothetical protein